MYTPQNGRIFISYRRADSAGYAGRIYDRLTAHFGVDAVFMDVDTIEAGLDFVEVLQNAVQSCDVLIALIGRRWLDSKDADGKRRLENPEDFVRVEIAAALDRDIRVIPVLVDGVLMPRSIELPDNLKTLARRNALQVNHPSFNADAYRLISQLELALNAAEDSRILKARRLQEERERKEKKAREAEERKGRGQEERTRLGAEQRAKKEREEQLRKEIEEKKRKDTLRKERLQKTAESIKNVFSGGRKLPFVIGGGIATLFLIVYIFKIALAPYTPSSPIETTATPALTLATATATELQAEIPLPPTLTNEPEPTATETPEILGVGSTMISEKDGMVMIYIPAGEFQMGSETGSSDEKPIHKVYLDAFWIDQTEVTNAMYAKCVAANECDEPVRGSSYTRNGYYGNPEFDDYPVIYVSWEDAKAYCSWADHRLPTEAEWEKAAGWDAEAGAQRIYPWGDSIDGRYANYNSNVNDTTAVGNYKKGMSFYGAYDMAGNVWEWVGDWYVNDYYANSPATNPLGPETGNLRVLRGGSWGDLGINLRSANRSENYPSFAGSYNAVGFRCARDVSQ